MKKREIDKNVRQAFSKVVPDVLDAVLLDCKQQEGKVIVLSETTVNRKPMAKRIIGIAAAFAVVFAAVMGYMFYAQNYKVASTVSLDVNPSIEITVNQKERVLDVRANNEDGKIVIGDMDFKGNSLDVTVNALIGSMLKNGYINELANSILVSVNNQDQQQGAQLQQKLTEEINQLLQTNSFSGAVLSQTIQQDESLQQLADQYGITLGKAQLINQIIEKNALYTFADLVPLSINELNLLSESGSSQLENVSSVGVASDKAYIGQEKAKQIAFEHAGVTQSDVRKLEIEMDYEYGVMVYELDFDANGFEYEYDINAATGEILKNEKKADDDWRYGQNSWQTGQNYQGDNCEYIGEGKAKQIAMNHAGVTQSVMRNLKIVLDEWVYEVEFDANGYEYDYDIDAVTGEILKNEKQADSNWLNNPQAQPGQGGQNNQASQGNYIGQEKAKQIALEHAGVAQDSLRKLEIDLDREHGVMVYEVEFDANGYEYSYDINASTGQVLKYEKEYDD